MTTLTFERANKLIVVEEPDTAVSVQEIYDKAQDWLDEPENMRELTNVEAQGKFDLGGGEFTGVSLKLLNGWRVQFRDRPSFVLCSVTGGNLIAVDEAGDPSDPIAQSTNTFVVIRQSTAAAAIATGAGLLTGADVAALADGVWDEQYTGHETAGSMARRLVDTPRNVFNKVVSFLLARGKA